MGAGKYFAIWAILCIDLIVMAVMQFRLVNNFYLELLLLLLSIIVSLMIFTGISSGKRWAWNLAAVFFIAFIINIFFMYYNATHGRIITGGAAIISVIGFIIALSAKGSRCRKHRPAARKEPEEENVVLPPGIKVEPYGKEEKKKVSVKTEFKPGKYVASKMASNYHIPKCDWAKKIKKKNQVWFSSEQEAKRAGYSKHSCLK